MNGTKHTAHDPSPGDDRDPLQILQNRIKWTYLARLEASKRLHSNNTAVSSALVLFNLASVLSAIRLLVEPQPGIWPSSPLTSIAFAVIALSLSLYSATANYGQRSQMMFGNYREIQKLWAATELEESGGRLQSESLETIRKQYDDQLDGHENHTTRDYKIASFHDTRRTQSNRSSARLSSQNTQSTEAPTSNAHAPHDSHGHSRPTARIRAFYDNQVPLFMLKIAGRMSWSLAALGLAATSITLATGYL